MMKNVRIVILGTGKMATFLLSGLINSGLQIIQLYGRSQNRLAELSAIYSIPSILDIQDISRQADLYILALSDDAIPKVSGLMPDVEGLVVHTSGAASIFDLDERKRRGVFYPLQTFSGPTPPSIKDTPILTEALDDKDAELLNELASSLSDYSYTLNSEKRLQLHLGAVLVNNFTNHLFELAEEFLNENDIPVQLLHPLMERTMELALAHPGETRQTGPAQRGDIDTIKKHLDMIQGDEHLSAIYNVINESIAASSSKKYKK